MTDPQLSVGEKDVLGEIGNMSMGSAATSLSQILKKDVRITTPKVSLSSFNELFGAFQVPYVAIRVNYTEGLHGFNVLVIKLKDARAILGIMLGKKMENLDDKLNEIEMSALSEVMNQMMGSAATALNQIYDSTVQISAPVLDFVNVEVEPQALPSLEVDEPLVTVAFRMEINDLVDSEIIHVLPYSAAKEQAEIVLSKNRPKALANEKGSSRTVVNNEPKASVPVHKAQFGPLETRASNGGSQHNLNLLMDLPLEATVVLGSVNRTVKEVLAISEGSVLELDKLVEEPVDLLVNGKLVAKGEIVVVNENFGLRITEVVSSSARLNSVIK